MHFSLQSSCISPLQLQQLPTMRFSLQSSSIGSLQLQQLQDSCHSARSSSTEFLVRSSFRRWQPSHLHKQNVTPVGGVLTMETGYHSKELKMPMPGDRNVVFSSDCEASHSMETGSSLVSPDLSMGSSGIIPQELAEQLVDKAVAWASLHGLVVGDRFAESSGRKPGVVLVHAPLSLLPTPFPEEQYKQAMELASLFNELVDRVSMDGEFLQETLSRTRKVDSFTARLLDIHAKVMQQGVPQGTRLGLHRSDYMVDMYTGNLLQIELNTISCSFASLGTLVSQLHRYLIGFTKHHCSLQAKKVPENKALEGFAEALALSFKEFRDPSAVVLVVVQPEEHNVYDQHWLELRLYESYGIAHIRRTLAEVHSQAKLHEDGSLIIGEQTVAVVYYRAGYGPNDYPSEAEWSARTLIECSNAIKCPTISYHLVGTKKIQQELGKPGVLERFVQDAEAVYKLRRCFAGLWGLEDVTSLMILDDAITRPESFVLKPQREGGGNNLYGKDMKDKLSELKERGGCDKLAAYILMQRIFPAVHTSYFVREGRFSSQQAISELGIFSTYLRNNDGVILNKPTGYLLRTKSSSSDEGGVAAGFAVLDSVYLV